MFIYKGCTLCVCLFFFFNSYVCLVGKCVLGMICIRHDVNIAARFVKKMTLNPSQGYANKSLVRDAFRMCSSRRTVVFVIEESLFDSNINIIFVSSKMQWCENKKCLFNKNVVNKFSFFFLPYTSSHFILRDYKLGK